MDIYDLIAEGMATEEDCQGIDKLTLRQEDEFGNGPLYYAIFNRDLDICKKLLAIDPSIVFEKRYRDNYFHLAAMRGAFDICQFIVGIDRKIIWERGSSGDTALHCATRNANYDLTKLLLETKWIKNVFEQTAMFQVWKHDKRIYKLLVDIWRTVSPTFRHSFPRKIIFLFEEKTRLFVDIFPLTLLI